MRLRWNFLRYAISGEELWCRHLFLVEESGFNLAQIRNPQLQASFLEVRNHLNFQDFVDEADQDVVVLFEARQTSHLGQELSNKIKHSSWSHLHFDLSDFTFANFSRFPCPCFFSSNSSSYSISTKPENCWWHSSQKYRPSWSVNSVPEQFPHFMIENICWNILRPCDELQTN